MTSCSPSRVRFDLDSSPHPLEQEKQRATSVVIINNSANGADDDAESSPLPIQQHQKKSNNTSYAASPSPVASPQQQQHYQKGFYDDPSSALFGTIYNKHQQQLPPRSALDEGWTLLFRALCDEHGCITEGSVHARLSMLLPALDWCLPLHDSGVLYPPATAAARAFSPSKKQQLHRGGSTAATAGATSRSKQRSVNHTENGDHADKEKSQRHASIVVSEHGNNNNNSTETASMRRRRRGGQAGDGENSFAATSVAAAAARVSIPPSMSPVRNKNQQQQQQQAPTAGVTSSSIAAYANNNMNSSGYRHHHHHHHPVLPRLIDGSVVKHTLFRRLLRRYLPVLGYNTPLPIAVLDEGGGFADPAAHLDVFSGFVASAVVNRMRIVVAKETTADILLSQQQQQQPSSAAAIDPEELCMALLSLPLSVESVGSWTRIRDVLLQSCGDATMMVTNNSTNINSTNINNNNDANIAPASVTSASPAVMLRQQQQQQQQRNYRPYSMPVLTPLGEPDDEEECVRILLLVLLRNSAGLRPILQRYEAPGRQLARVLIAKRMAFAVASTTTTTTIIMDHAPSNNNNSNNGDRSEMYRIAHDNEDAGAATAVADTAAQTFAQELCRWTLHLWIGARGVLDTPIMQRIGERYMLRKAKEFQKLAKRFRRFFVELEEQDECDMLRAGRANSPGQLVQKPPATPAAVVLQQPSAAAAAMGATTMSQRNIMTASMFGGDDGSMMARSVSPQQRAPVPAAVAASSPVSFLMSQNNNNNSMLFMAASLQNQQHQQQRANFAASAEQQQLLQRDELLDQLSQNPAVWLKQVENSMEPPPLSLLHHMLPEDREELDSARKWASARAFVVGFVAALVIAGSDVLASMILFGPEASISTKLGIGADFGAGAAGGSSGIQSIIQFLGPAAAPSLTTTTTSAASGGSINGTSSMFNNASSNLNGLGQQEQILGTKEVIAYWIIVLSVTVLMSLAEMMYLFVDALNTCYDCAVVVGIVLRHRTEDGKKASWRDVLKTQLSSSSSLEEDAEEPEDGNDAGADDDDQGSLHDDDDNHDNDDDGGGAKNNNKKKVKRKALGAEDTGGEQEEGTEEEDARFAEELIDIFIPGSASPIGSPSRRQHHYHQGYSPIHPAASPGRTARVAKSALRNAVVASLRAAARVREVVCRKRCKFIDGAISRCALSLGHGTISLFGIDLNRTRDGWARMLKKLFQLLRTPLSVVIVQLLLGRLVWKVFIPFVSAPVCAMWNAVVIWGAISEMHSTVVAAVGAERLVLEVAQKCKDLHLGGSTSAVTATTIMPTQGDAMMRMSATVNDNNNTNGRSQSAATMMMAGGKGAAAAASALPETVDVDYAMPHHILQLWARAAFSVGSIEALSTPSFHIVVAGLLQRLGSVVPMRGANSSSASTSAKNIGLDDEVTRFMSSLSSEQEIARLDLTNTRLFLVSLSGAVNKSTTLLPPLSSSPNSSASSSSLAAAEQAREYARGVTTSVVAMQLALLIVLDRMDQVCNNAKSKYRKMLCATIACYAAPKIAFAASGAASQLSGQGVSTASSVSDLKSSSSISKVRDDDNNNNNHSVDGGDDRQRSISRMMFLEKEMQQQRQQQSQRQASLMNSRCPSQQLRAESNTAAAGAAGARASSPRGYLLRGGGGGGDGDDVDDGVTNSNNNKKSTSTCCWCCWCVDTSCCDEVGEFSNSDVHAAFMHKITGRAKAVTEHVSAFLLGSKVEKTILWAELTAEKNNVAAAATTTITATEKQQPIVVVAAQSVDFVEQTAAQQQPLLPTAAAAAENNCPAASASPSPIKQQPPVAAAISGAGEGATESSSSPLVVGRIVSDRPQRVPSSSSSSPLSGCNHPSSAVAAGTGFVSSGTPSPLLLSSQLVPRSSNSRHASVASGGSPHAHSQSLRRNHGVSPFHSSNGGSLNNSYRQSRKQQQQRISAHGNQNDSDDDEVLLLLDEFFDVEHHHHTNNKSNNNNKSRAASSSRDRCPLPPAPSVPVVLGLTGGDAKSKSKSKSSGRSASAPSSSASSESERIQEHEAVRLLMFEAGASRRKTSSRINSSSNETSKEPHARGSTTRQNSSSADQNGAAGAAAAGVATSCVVQELVAAVAAKKRNNNCNLNRTSSSSSSASVSSSQNVIHTASGQGAAGGGFVDWGKQLLEINGKLLKMQQRFNAGAPMSGALLVEVAATMVDLCSMWEYRDS